MKRKWLHPASVNLTVNQLNQIHNDRIQDEIKVANSIREQHPDISRDDALRAAADIVERDYKEGKAPA